MGPTAQLLHAQVHNFSQARPAQLQWLTSPAEAGMHPEDHFASDESHRDGSQPRLSTTRPDLSTVENDQQGQQADTRFRKGYYISYMTSPGC